MIDHESDSGLALTALTQVRRLVCLAQLVIVGVDATVGHFHDHHYIALGAVALLVFAELARASLGRQSDATQVVVHVIVDTLALAVIAASQDHAHAPLEAFVLVELAIASSALDRQRSWPLATAALAITLGATFLASGAEPEHGLGHAAAVIAVVWFSTQLAEARRAQTERLRQAEADRERGARLASIGTMAAGVAHELGTPLGSIELLAEEAAHSMADDDPAREALATLRGQVRRCRSILDRLLERGDAVTTRTPAFSTGLHEWVEAWRIAQPEAMKVELDLGALDTPVLGDPAGWRAVTWTLLDNARRAGAGKVRVTLAETAGSLAVHFDDDGSGLPDDWHQVGEPFFSGWSEPGAGLGLYTSRRFARAVGGELSVEPRDNGARVTLTAEVA